MPEYKLRYKSIEDGCIYCWDEENKSWMKICPVEELPPEIRAAVLADKQRAALVLRLPL